MKRVFLTSLAAVLAFSTAAFADFQKVSNQSDFVSAVNGKRLTRPLVELVVTSGGGISGTGVIWDVSGNWTWENGYFCRSLEWGGDDLGYNCQEVALKGSRIRFTSDKGGGQSADFTLR